MLNSSVAAGLHAAPRLDGAPTPRRSSLASRFCATAIVRSNLDTRTWLRTPLAQTSRSSTYLVAEAKNFVDTAFSLNDWTAFVVFIVVVSGIVRLEGPIIGAAAFVALREAFAGLGTIYLLMLGAVAIVVMLKAPKGIWGLVADRFGWQLFPPERRVRLCKQLNES